MIIKAIKREEDLFSNQALIKMQGKFSIVQEFTQTLKEMSTNYSRIMQDIWQRKVNLNNEKFAIFDHPN